MFERYTEKARKVIFYGRFEASGFGDTEIRTEHLFLGLVKEDSAMLRDCIAGDPLDRIIEEMRGIAEIRREQSITPTSVDMPLSNDCKSSLSLAGEEAELLKNQKIETEHLLLGIVREETGGAGRILRKNGLSLGALREEVKSQRPVKGTFVGEFQPVGPSPAMPQILVVDAETEATISIMRWTGMLPIPRTGETIVIEGARNNDRFQVAEVRYHFAAAASGQWQPQLAKVVLRVISRS